MSTIILDIETAPLPAVYQEQFAPEFTANALLKPGQPPEDMPIFTNGTLKQPEDHMPKFPRPKRTPSEGWDDWEKGKVEKWEAEQARRRIAISNWVEGKEAAWHDEQLDRDAKIAADIEAQRAAWLDKAQLDAMRCRVCAVGVTAVGEHDKHNGEIVLMGIEDQSKESDIIEEAWAYVRRADKVAGHNIGYDLGILAQRSAILNIPVPKLTGFNPSFYDSDKFIDTMTLWKPKGSSVATPADLDMIGRALGIGGKPRDMSGKDFWRADEATQREYLTWDLRACAEILKRMGGAA